MTGPLEALGSWANAPPQANLSDLRQRIDQPFTLEGHITGTFTDEQALASGSLNFFIRPQPNEIYFIARINLRFYDQNINDGDVYGSAGLLATGIALKLWDEGDDVEVYNFTPHRITTIHDWALYAGRDSVVNDVAQTDAYVARWTFTRAGSGMVVVDGSEDHVLRLEIPDDISAIDSQVVMAQGYKKLASG